MTKLIIEVLATYSWFLKVEEKMNKTEIDLDEKKS